MNLSLKNERSGFRKENGLRETAGSEEIRDLESDCLYMQDSNCKKNLETSSSSSTWRSLLGLCMSVALRKRPALLKTTTGFGIIA